MSDLARRLRGDQKAVPILFLDLDGTVRKGFDEIGRFVNGPEDVQIFDEVPALLRRYKDRGWRIVGVTNQGGVALGHLTFDAMTEALAETARQCGAGTFDRVISCVHHPRAADPEMAVCWCRKPRIGMLVFAGLSLGHQHHDEFYPPHLMLMVGDRPEDEECARNAGIAFKWAAEWRREALS
jgi:D-glycero-D-manno-heptose 1,7-bisphosphate phosphatase